MHASLSLMRTVSNTQKINIRPMTPEDIDSIIAIDTKITGIHRTLTYAKPHGSFFGGELGIGMVAEANGKVVGFILGRLAPSPRGWLNAWAHFIGVDPDYQRRGVGTKLVEGFVARCKTRRAKTMHMMINWYDWEMVAFLQSLGFSRGDLSDFVMAVEE